MELKDRIARYRADAWLNVSGWVDATVVDATEIVAAFQDAHETMGDALEIGVFHGRYFLALMAAIRPGECALAVDIFDRQALNVDGSGLHGNLSNEFRASIDRFAADPSAARIMVADSLTTRAGDLLAQSASNGFRLISVDGGHTPEHVMNDLGLAADVIVAGGAVFLDDWMSPHWPGVHEGYLRYMTTRNRNLAPLFYTGNKLILSTISDQAAMLAWMADRYRNAHQDVRRVTSCGFSFLSAV